MYDLSRAFPVRRSAGDETLGRRRKKSLEDGWQKKSLESSMPGSHSFEPRQIPGTVFFGGQAVPIQRILANIWP
jgi:hypothetical protein